MSRINQILRDGIIDMSKWMSSNYNAIMEFYRGASIRNFKTVEYYGVYSKFFVSEFGITSILKYCKDINRGEILSLSLHKREISKSHFIKFLSNGWNNNVYFIALTIPYKYGKEIDTLLAIDNSKNIIGIANAECDSYKDMLTHVITEIDKYDDLPFNTRLLKRIVNETIVSA